MARTPTWWQRALRLALVPCAIPYWLASQAKNWLFDSGWRSVHQSSLPTISVGNLSVGGTGKSPTVAWVAGLLRKSGVRVAVLSRGYGQLEHGQNDEALELEILFPDVPHLQHWDRVASSRIAEEEFQMEALLLDDGFQHRRLGRDLDIVLIDASDPPRARRVLPWGLFREPMSNLKRAQIVILTRVEDAQPGELAALRRATRRFAANSLHLEASFAPRRLFQFHGADRDCSVLKGKKILAFCGIGNPEAFFSSLADRVGAEVLATKVWPDHHAYAIEDVVQMEAWTGGFDSVDFIVCTMKDAVKLQVAKLNGVPLVALQIELHLTPTGELALSQRIDECVVAPEKPLKSS